MIAPVALVALVITALQLRDFDLPNHEMWE